MTAAAAAAVLEEEEEERHDRSRSIIDHTVATVMLSLLSYKYSSTKYY